ncbi:MAG TPA: TraB/GumN family protein [Flavobacteriales bacterium]|nr:TraB/GumN family protein [Flavobacteriales bacterium]HRE96595.1 TraB/GumN family protein [Flavobacteriales bacterium]HRJ36675.1 TraB/GumN family protein [Flavobacteriales bacterium]HRJ38830.1 TraB/GumN family protein [Flavobacteriales bacterium]
MKKNQIKALIPASVGFILFLLACTGKKQSLQEQLGYEYAENENSLLWEISGNGLAEPSYLYGTIHIQRKEVFDYDTLVGLLVDTCAAYAMELNMEEMNPFKVAKMMALDEPLDKLIPVEKYNQLDSFFRAETGTGIGLRKTTKPFFLMSEIMMKEIGGDMPMALDLHFFSQAKSKKKKVIGIEKFEEQMAAVDELTVEEQVDIILKGLGDSTSSLNKFDELIETYLKGDLEGMVRLTQDTLYPPKFNKAFLIDRNIVMADRIADICNKQVTFNAIGAGHLGGPEGVIALLRKKGYTVKPIKTTFGNKQLKK